MTSTVELGTVVWLALAGTVVAWLAVVALRPAKFVGPRRVARWLLSSLPSRLMVLAAWGAAGWHVFCQRP